MCNIIPHSEGRTEIEAVIGKFNCKDSNWLWYWIFGLYYCLQPEYLKTTMHVCPRITQPMLILRSPWIVGMVSLPTLWSQIVSTFRRTENASMIWDTRPAAILTMRTVHAIPVWIWSENVIRLEMYIPVHRVSRWILCRWNSNLMSC